MFSDLLQTARGILNSLICVSHFSSNFNSVFHKEAHAKYWCCSKKKEQIGFGYLEY